MAAFVLAAIADPVRCAWLRVLAEGQPQSVNALAGHLRRPADGISKHLRILRHARLIRAVTLSGHDGLRPP